MKITETNAFAGPEVLRKVVLKLPESRANRASSLSDDIRNRQPRGRRSYLHAIVLPVITPNQTETKPTTTLRTTFNPAIRTSPSCKTRKVSYSKVEKVLYPPMNP